MIISDYSNGCGGGGSGGGGTAAVEGDDLLALWRVSQRALLDSTRILMINMIATTRMQ